MANFLNNQSMAGLNTTTIGVPTTDRYTIQGTLTAPNLESTPLAGPGGGAGTGTNVLPAQVNSQVVVTIKQNASTIYTSDAGDRGFHLTASLSAGDIISVITTSSLVQDQQLNSVKTTIQIFESGI